jgi:hypothetical protein
MARRPFLLLAIVDLGYLIHCEATSGGPWCHRCEGGDELLFLFWLGRTVTCSVSDLRTGPGPPDLTIPTVTDFSLNQTKTNCSKAQPITNRTN